MPDEKISDTNYNVEVYRFRTSGKYYDTITIQTKSRHVWQVIEEIELKHELGELNGNYDYMITGEGFPNTGFPALLKLSNKH